MTTKRIVVALTVALFGTTALAQDVGAGPVASVGADVPRSAQVAPQASQQAPASVANEPVPTTTKKTPRLKTVAPPPEITVQSGRNTAFSVALFHVNRIVTPFRTPEVRTSSTATLTIENGIVYVTTQSEEPIGLFVFDKANPAQAISLTLMPNAISPVSVKINLDGYTADQGNHAIAGNPSLARTWETDDPYVETVKNLFKDLAQGRVPDGFGLGSVPARYAYTPKCSQYGLNVVPMQLIEGAEVTAIVARVTNVAYQPIEINESECKSDRLIGAATWPRALLNPGESAELYLAIRSPASDEVSSVRPSVIGGSH